MRHFISFLFYLVVLLLYVLIGSKENGVLFLCAAWQVGYLKDILADLFDKRKMGGN